MNMTADFLVRRYPYQVKTKLSSGLFRGDDML